MASFNQKYNKPVFQLLVAVTISMLVANVYAAEVTKKAVVTAGIEYDSNPSMADSNKTPVWTYSLTPQIQLDINNEVNHWFVDAAVLVQRHSNEQALIDREDPKLSAGWERTYESGLLGITADYYESSTRINELQTTGVFSTKDNTQKNKSIAAKWQQTINPSWSLLTEGGYEDINFGSSGNAVVSNSLNNYTLGKISTQLSYANSEKLDTLAFIGYSQLSPEKTYENTDLTRVDFGANYKINESLTLSPRVGVYNLSGRQSDTDWEASVEAKYVLERMNYSALVSRQIHASSAGGFRKVDNLNLGLQFDMTDQVQIGAGYVLEKFKKDSTLSLDWLDSQVFNVFYNRTLSDHWKTQFYASHREYDLPGSNPSGEIVGVTLAYDTLSF
jgi:hypothetical protein